MPAGRMQPLLADSAAEKSRQPWHLLIFLAVLAHLGLMVAQLVFEIPASAATNSSSSGARGGGTASSGEYCVLNSCAYQGNSGGADDLAKSVQKALAGGCTLIGGVSVGGAGWGTGSLELCYAQAMICGQCPGANNE